MDSIGSITATGREGVLNILIHLYIYINNGWRRGENIHLRGCRQDARSRCCRVMDSYRGGIHACGDCDGGRSSILGGHNEGSQTGMQDANTLHKMSQVKAHELRSKSKADLSSQLTELKQELLQLRVAKVTGGNTAKLTKL